MSDELLMKSGSDVKSDRYSMTVPVKLVLGTRQIFDAALWTMVTFKPELIVTNAPAPCFVVLDSVIVDGVEIVCFSGEMGVDAYIYRPAKNPKDFDHPTEDERREFDERSEARQIKAPNIALCEHGISVVGSYSGLVPSGCKVGETVTFRVGLQGPIQKK